MLRLMISRALRPVLAIGLVLIVSLITAACEKTPFTAPTGSSITLTTSTNAIAAGGSATIIAQVLESAGTPPHSGTQVTFTTTLGVIEPSTASTDSSGRATVTFRPNGANGIAIVSASSGGASTSSGSSSQSSSTSTTSTGTTSNDRNLRISVGSAAVGRVLLSANPTVLTQASFGPNGQSVSLAANVVDVNGNALAGVPVTFTTNAGALSQVSVNTDGNGNAFNSLMTTQATTVTAGVGLATGSSSSSGGSSGGNAGSGGSAGATTTNNVASVNITLAATPLVSIGLPSASPSAGLPSTYTFKVTPAGTSSGGSSSGGSSGGSGGSSSGTASVPIRSLVVNWGDSRGDQLLGAVNSEQAVSYTYSSSGTYTIKATATDIANAVGSVSTIVTVIPVARPTVIITPSPQSGPTGTNFTLKIEISAPTGLQIQNVVLDFGDDTPVRQLGGVTGTLQPTHTYTGLPGKIYNITVTVTDATGQTTIGTASISITN